MSRRWISSTSTWQGTPDAALAMRPGPTFCSLSCDSSRPPCGCFLLADVSLPRTAWTASSTRGGGTGRKSGATMQSSSTAGRGSPSNGNCVDCAPRNGAKIDEIKF